MIAMVALQNLRRSPRRTLAIIATIAIGASSIFIAKGFNNGLMSAYRNNAIHSRYGHGQIFTQGYRDEIFQKPWEHWITNFSSVKESLSKNPAVSQVFPRVSFFALLSNGQITVNGIGEGVDAQEEAKFFKTMRIIDGTPLTDQQDGILVGAGLARALQLKPGDRVTLLANTVFGSINAADLIVSGIFRTGSKDFDDQYFRIPLSQAQTLIDTDKVEKIVVALKDDAEWSSVAEYFKNPNNNSLNELEAIPFEDIDRVYYRNATNMMKQQFYVVLTIILIIVTMGIFNSISTAVLERKQEIGNLRANGESAGDVVRLVTLEGIFLGLIGSIIGVLLSYLIVMTVLAKGIKMPPPPMITVSFWVNIELHFTFALIVCALCASTAVVGSFLAGLRVARMPIAEALRST